jgi:phosphopantothenoylcysteine decarboxylase / phosphopantothenate---cysteine ligase
VTSASGRPCVVLGVSGGIAAYKACSLLRLLTESGADVHVVPTAGALHFVGEATWAALSGNPVHTAVWDDVHEVPHVRLGRQADLVVVAPATADLLARAAHGLADDLLTATLLTARCPVLLAPAMHTEMWQHPATVANVATLRSRGVVVVDPDSGRLTGVDSGAGRLPEPEQLFEHCHRLLAPPVEPSRHVGGDLSGRHVVISAGGTREPLDPVRYLGNRSSGRMGIALAAAAAARGANVTLVAANVEPALPAGVTVVAVETAEQLRRQMLALAADADVIVMAAAVADFRPAGAAAHKIKKTDGDDTGLTLELERTPDVLAELVGSREVRDARQLIVGFAAETGDERGSVLDHARAKLHRKGCDLLVVNDVSQGKVFGRADTQVTVLVAGGGQVDVPAGSKHDAAQAIWDVVESQLRTTVGASRPSTATGSP